jgi:hypothetical protein
MNNFFPPKIEIELKDLQKIFAIGLEQNFWDLEFVATYLDLGKNKFLEGGQKASLFELLLAGIDYNLSKIPVVKMVDFLQSQYFGLGQKSPTGLILYLLYFSIAKQKHPEMLAFAYNKLPSQKELTDQVRDLLHSLQKKL